MTSALIRRLYREVLLSAEFRGYLDDYRGRLDRSYRPDEREVAVLVLSALSRNREGLDLAALQREVAMHGGEENLLERVLALLRGDFYVSQDESGRYRFFNRYLADWWQRFHA